MKASMCLWYTNPVLRKCINELKWIEEAYEVLNDIDSKQSRHPKGPLSSFDAHNIFGQRLTSRKNEEILDFLEEQDLSFRDKDEAKERLQVIFGLRDLSFDNYEEIAAHISNELEDKFRKAADHCKEQHENPKQAIATSNDLVSEYVVYLTEKFLGRCFEDDDDLVRILEREDNRSEREDRSDSD